MLRTSWLTRSWIAASTLLAVALAATLSAPTIAHIAVAPAAQKASLVGEAGFADLVVPPPGRDDAVAAAAPQASDAAVAGSAAAGGAMERASRSASARGVPRAPATGDGTWAVIIGINDYPGTSNDLDAAVNDAVEVERAMLMLGAGRDHVLTLLDGAATGGAIRNGLEWLTANAGPDAVAVFFFAGHAVKQGPGREAIVGSDLDRVADAEMSSRLAPLAANRAWIAIAGCYAGGFTEVLAPGRILTGAAGADGLAYENGDFNRSYMVEYMVHRAIVEGRAADSVQSAFAYAADALSREYPGRQPVQVDDGAGPLDLRPSEPAPSAPPPSSPPPPPQSPPPPPADGPSPPPTTTPPPQGASCWLKPFCG